MQVSPAVFLIGSGILKIILRNLYLLKYDMKSPSSLLSSRPWYIS